MGTFSWQNELYLEDMAGWSIGALRTLRFEQNLGRYPLNSPENDCWLYSPCAHLSGRRFIALVLSPTQKYI